MSSVVFIGHNECYGLSIKALNEVIKQCIENGTTTFLSGGQGRFDRVCATAVFKLKKEYPHIKNVLIIPYLSFNVFNREIFDEIVFPNGFEKYHFKAAILQRNRYMVNQSEVAICFIEHGWGNAIKTYEFAKKKNLKTINLSRYDG